MTPEERRLVDGLFERMRGYGALDKDREAETIINQAVRGMPDAPYMLVQSVLAQEHALQEAGRRIQDLEAQVRSLQGEGPPRAPAGSGSFLGGLLGGGRPASEPGATSVPPIGSRPSAASEGQRPGAWASPPQPPPPAPAGGGFLRSAMATAAGVAGGMLAAGAIRDALGGGGASTTAAQQTPPAATTATQQAKAEQPQTGADDAAPQDAYSDGDDSDWGGGDDIEI